MECKLLAINRETTGFNASGGQKDVVTITNNLQNGEDLPSVEVNVVQLSIHVHSCTNRKDKPADPVVDSIVFLNTLHH